MEDYNHRMEYLRDTNEIIMHVNDYIRLNTKFYKYIGCVKTVQEVPDMNCLYTIDGLLYIRRVNLEKLEALKALERQKRNKKQEVDDSTELSLDINPGDDATLIIAKELLKGFTKNTFRKLFDSDSDMNNMRRAIEHSPNGQLSLNRFKILLQKLGLQYKIIVFTDEDDEAINNKELSEKLNNLNEFLDDMDAKKHGIKIVEKDSIDNE